MATHRGILLAVVGTTLAASACTAGSGSSGVTSPPTPTPVNTTGRAAAWWALSQGFVASPGSTSLTVDVRWIPCASGVAVEDPKPVVTYSATRVSLSVWGIPPSGDFFSCQGNKITTIEVPLSEPLGDRTVVEGTKPDTVLPAVTGGSS
jgi:hypothetical protein